MDRSENGSRTVLIKIVCVALIFLGGYFVLKYAFGTLLPFLIALIIAIPIRALADVSSKKLLGKKKYWSIFYISVFWCFVFLFLIFAVRYVLIQTEALFSYLMANRDGIANSIEAIIEKMSDFVKKIPFLSEMIAEEGFIEEASKSISDFVKSIAQKGTSLAASLFGALIARTPGAIISVVVCIISSVYFSLDADKIKEYFKNVFNKRNSEKVRYAIKRIKTGAKGYLKAYGILFLINFLQMLVGLLLLRRNFAFVIALILGFLDILPFFSAAVVLVPWGIVLITWGDYGVGIGLIILSAVVAIVRQITEPRLVGKSLGLHPLASLFSMYVGMKFFGFLGMISAPVISLIIKEFLEARNSKSDKLKLVDD